jgi:thiol:disulfide interchange protein
MHGTGHARRLIPIAALSAALAASAGAAAQPRGAAVETRWEVEPAPAAPGSSVRATLRIEVEPTYHVQSDKPLDDFLIPTTLTLTPPAGIAVREVLYPKPVLFRVEYDLQPLSVFEHAFAIQVTLAVADGVPPGRHTVKAVLQYQACDDKKCLNPVSRDVPLDLEVAGASAIEAPPPGDAESAAAPDGPAPAVAPPPSSGCDELSTLDRFTTAGTAGGYMKTAEFLAFINAAESGAAQPQAFAGKGTLGILLSVFLGGIALNLTPCVLPLVPITLAVIGAGVKSGSRRRGFALGGTYGLAMALAYGALGLVVILTASAFGAINSTVWFNAGIAALFVVLALAMFDVIHIDFSSVQSRLNLGGSGRTGSLAVAFGMGAVAALLAGACVAPVVIQVVVYAADQYARGAGWALLLPFVLGVGMAVPWPFAGAGLSFLPKPGRWMVRVKQVMGVVILVFAAYYGFQAWEIYGSRAVASGGAASHRDANDELEDGWTRSLCAGLARAEAEGRPALIDMWATWCKNCFVMDRTTLKDPEVLTRLEGYVKIKFQAEDLEATPAREMLDRFGGVGLPHYAIVKPKR